MKKFITLALALVLVLSMASVAFADYTGEVTDQEVVDVEATYSVVPSETLIAITIEWEDPKWTYEVDYKWNPDDHANEIETTEWTSTQNGSVTVINHSNAAVDVTYAVTKLEGYENVEFTYGEIEPDVATTVDAADGDLVDDVTLAIADIDYDQALDIANGEKASIASITVTVEQHVVTPVEPAPDTEAQG